MKTKLGLPFVLAGSVALSGCFDGSDGVAPSTQVRVIHGVSDAPAVNVNINGEVSVPGADFKQAAILNPALGSYSVSVDGILPDGSTTTVIQPTNLTFEAGIDYDIIASGSVGGGTVAPIVLADDGTRANPDSVRLRVVHLSPDAQDAAGGPVDVYVTLSGDPLPAQPTVPSFSFGDDAGPLEIDAATYQVRITPEGTPGTVVFDSGALPLAAGSDLIVAAIDNTLFGGPAPDGSPSNLLVVNGSDTTEYFSVTTGAGIRAVHNSADAGEVDVYLNKDPATATADVSGLAYGETVPTNATTGAYQGLAVGSNRIAITAADGTIPVIDENPDLSNGQLLTILAAGNTTAGIEPLIFGDDNRRIATAAKLRVIHGAVEAQVVDVYLIPTADTGAVDTMIGNAEPVEDDFEYGESTGYLPVAQGDYVIFVTDTDGNELFKSGSVTLAAGGIYTAVARLNNDPGSVATVTLLDDFVVVPPPT